jgi:flagellar motility protein MotE (MotC chaperone)
LKSIRLLPVVIFAALALLVFKGIGLVTDGGYVLTGPLSVAAQEGGDMSLSTPSEAMMTDASPTLGDTAPTLAAKSEPSAASDHGAPALGEVGASSSGEASAPGGADSSSSAGEAPKDKAVVCPESPPPSEPGQHDQKELTDKIGTALATACPPPSIPVNAHGDVLPSTKNGLGKIVPLEVAEGDDSETALLQRLGERRAELDKREADIAMRESIVAAAEKKLDERTRALEDLQAQVDALVDEKQAAEEASFKAIVSMYENMKPKDAAKIFDTLDLNVLLKVARAMNPRKMSPILAAMSAEPAQALTTAFASTGDTNTVAMAGTGEDLAALPQIVGH